MAIAVNNLIRATYFQRLFAQRILTVLHLRCVTAPTGTSTMAQLDNLATVLASPSGGPMFPDWQSNVAPQLLFDEVRCQVVWPARTVYGKAPMLFTGTHLDDCTTPNVAASIEKRSSVAGRHGIGRVQMAGIPETEYVAGELNAPYLEDLQDQWNDLELLVPSAVDSGVYAFCLPALSIQPGDDDIVDVQAQSSVRVMRRRTLRVRE